jgi:N-acetylmuramoyl-L-alanine amidase
MDRKTKARYGVLGLFQSQLVQESDTMIALRHARNTTLAFAWLALCANAPCAFGKEPAAPPTAPAPPACQRSAFRVVLDVGHTADVAGATSARGATEYSFNLRLAQDVRQALLTAGFDKTVVLITTTPPFAGLFERASRANKMAPDLFISLHHDSVPDRLLETWTYEGTPRHFSDRFTGYAIFISTENAQRAKNLAFGRLLGKELQARGLHYTPHYTLPLMGGRRRVLLDSSAGVYRYNKLIVLKEVHVPAVLLEAGSIINRDEELALATPERRALISAAITAAVDDFCATRPRTPELAARPAARRGTPARSPRPSHRTAGTNPWIPPWRNLFTPARPGCGGTRAC